MSTQTAALVTIAATLTSEYVPANRMAVAPAVFARLCQEAGLRETPDELHINPADEDFEAIDALDDELRDRAQTTGEFLGGSCFVLFTDQGIDGCDVWARVSVTEVGEGPTPAELVD